MQQVFALFNQRKPIIAGLYLSAFMVFAFFAFSDYFISDSNVLIALLLSPFIIIIDRKSKSNRYLIPAVILVSLSIFTGVRSILFLGFIFSVLFIIDSLIGKTSWTFVWLLFFISPIFKFIAMTFGFPIRLFLSEISAKVLSIAGNEVTASGNIIRFNGTDFSVDPACVGLSMIVISFIIMLFIVSHFQRRTGKKLSAINCLIIISITFICNVICNLFRIIALVQFNILPDTIMHDVTGLVCLLLYVIVPVYVSIYLFYRKAGKYNQSETVAPHKFSSDFLPLPLIGLLLYSFVFVDKSIPAKTPDRQCMIDGFTKERLESGVITFKNEEGLIYVKPMNFYNAEHNPLVCWSGSGYAFKQYHTEIINGTEIYLGLILKGNEKIYSAWWFDKGDKKTISQFEWRIDAMKGGRYCLINVNAASKEELTKLTEELLKKNIFMVKSVTPLIGLTSVN